MVRLAAADPFERVEEVTDVGDALLQQVTDAVRVAAQQLGRVPLLDVLREHEHRRAGPPPADLERAAQSLVGERRRHPNVDDAYVGTFLLDRLDQPKRVADGGGDLVPFVHEEPREPLAKEDAVLRDHDAHGISTINTVGPPSGESRCSSPSSVPTRSRNPASPAPSPISAPPTPSSCTWIVSRSPVRRTVMLARVAFACFAMFVSASLTTK